MTHSEQIFQHLKHILIEYSGEMVVAVDESDNFYLNTHHVMKNKQPMYFGSAKINKSYVSYHLMPVYVFPELLNDISAELKQRMQGKSCFNFKQVNESLFSELSELTRAGYEKYKSAQYL